MNNDLYCLEEMLYKQKIKGIPYIDKPKTLEERNHVILFYVPTILKVIKSKFLNHPLYELKHHIGIDDLFQEAVIVAAKTIEKFQKEYCPKSDFQSHLVYRVIVELKRLLLRQNRLTTPSFISRQRGGWKEEQEDIFYFYLDESGELDESDGSDKKLFSFLKSANLIFSDNGGNGDSYNQGRVEQLIKSAKLSPLEEKVLRLRVGIDGKTLKNKEIGAITGLSSNVSVPIFYERAIRKLISAKANSRSKQEKLKFFQEIRRILIRFLSEREWRVFKAYYGLNGPKKTTKQIAKKMRLSKGRIGFIVRQSRIKILKSQDLQRFLLKGRRELFFLIQGLKLKPFHQDLLAKFYCLDGKFYSFEETVNKRYHFSLWKAQQKFKSSLPLVVGLAEFSRDIARVMEKREGGEKNEETRFNRIDCCDFCCNVDADNDNSRNSNFVI